MMRHQVMDQWLSFERMCFLMSVNKMTVSKERVGVSFQAYAGILLLYMLTLGSFSFRGILLWYYPAYLDFLLHVLSVSYPCEGMM